MKYPPYPVGESLSVTMGTPPSLDPPRMISHLHQAGGCVTRMAWGKWTPTSHTKTQQLWGRLLWSSRGEAEAQLGVPIGMGVQSAYT